MRYIDIGSEVVPKHCKYGPRPAEGIVFNNIEWWSITDHLVKERREKEFAAVQRAKEEAKKQISYDMTRNWSNTLASVKTQGNQKRLEKMEKEKQDKIDQYNEILKNRMLEKKEILANVKKIVFENQDAAKTVASAVGYSLVLDGRRKQIEFQNRIKNEEARKKVELGFEYKKMAEEFARDQLQARIREKEKKAIQRKYLDEQLSFRIGVDERVAVEAQGVLDLKRRRKEDEEELAEQKQDLINMRNEAEKIHHCNMVEKNYRKQFAARYMKKTETQLEFERKLVLEQEEEDEINKIYLDYDRKFKKERKEREEKIKNEQVERRIQRAEKLTEKLKEAAKKEEDRLKAAAEAKERDALKEEESKKELNQMALKSLLDGKRKSEQRKARRDYERKEEKKWELMQQYRSAEINDEWREADRRRKKEVQDRVRAAYDCQMKELKERQANDLKEWLEPLEKEGTEKAEFLQYCRETMDFVKEENLLDYPVQAAISKIRKTYGIRDEGQSQQRHEDLGNLNGRKSNPRSSITGCFCFKY